MSELLLSFIQSARDQCEAALPESAITKRDGLGSLPTKPDHLQSSIQYALQAGGKRVRPMLTYAAGRAVTSVPNPATSLDSAACAAEFLHTYSLIHDDLPAMDDDDLRRGKPSLHKAYDEATAILVGDGLQARAFE